MKFFRAALFAALTGWAAIDIYLAIAVPITVPGATALSLFQWDASNFLGVAAFREGWPSAVLGLIADLAVSLIWAAIFVGLAARVPAITRRPLLFGVLFGIVVLMVMNYCVVPLGAAHSSPTTLTNFLNNLLAHTLFFGIPVAYVARKRLSPTAGRGTN